MGRNGERILEFQKELSKNEREMDDQMDDCKQNDLVSLI